MGRRAQVGAGEEEIDYIYGTFATIVIHIFERMFGMRLHPTTVKKITNEEEI